MIRYGFNIRTRHGQRVDNILIMAATQDAAERRLRQRNVVRQSLAPPGPAA